MSAESKPTSVLYIGPLPAREAEERIAKGIAIARRCWIFERAPTDEEHAAIVDADLASRYLASFVRQVELGL